MNDHEAIELLKKLQKLNDAEYAHGAADVVLCDMLRELGHEKVVAEWGKIYKRYA